MATLQGAIDEFIAVMRQTTGPRFVPDDPPPDIPAYPAAIAYGSDGEYTDVPAGRYTGLHNVIVALVMPLNAGIQVCTQTMLPYAETVPHALYEHRNGRTSSHYETFEFISYSLGPLEWPRGQEQYGFLFTIHGVKIHNEV